MQSRALPVVLALAGIPAAGASNTAALDQQFEQTVKPFVAKYCVGCHSGQTPAAQFDLKSYTTLDMVTRDFPRWALVLDQAHRAGDAAQADAAAAAEARQQVIDWIQAVRAEEMRKNAGDPGLVLARRLSNAEYNYTIRDLTGAGHAAHARVSGGSGQSRGLRQLRRIADHVARAAEQIPAGRARSGRPHGADARWHRFRALSDAGRDGSRQVCDPAHRGFLLAAAHRLCGLLSGRVALTNIAPLWESRTRRWPPSRRNRR